MDPLSIVKASYPVHHIQSRLRPRFVSAPRRLLHFQCLEEALHRGIIPSIRPPTHRRHHAAVFDQLPMRPACILRSAIGVNNKAAEAGDVASMPNATPRTPASRRCARTSTSQRYGGSPGPESLPDTASLRLLAWTLCPRPMPDSVPSHQSVVPIGSPPPADDAPSPWWRAKRGDTPDVSLGAPGYDARARHSLSVPVRPALLPAWADHRYPGFVRAGVQSRHQPPRAAGYARLEGALVIGNSRYARPATLGTGGSHRTGCSKRRSMHTSPRPLREIRRRLCKHFQV